MRLFQWLFGKETQPSKKLDDDRSRILRIIEGSNLHSGTSIKAQAMIKAGGRETVSLTESILQKKDGLPSLAKLIDMHKTTAVQNSELAKLNRTLKKERLVGFLKRTNAPKRRDY
jgi:hypothetical protein